MTRWRDSALRERLLTPITIGKFMTMAVLFAVPLAIGLWGLDSAAHLFNADLISVHPYEAALLTTTVGFGLFATLLLLESYYAGYGNKGLARL